MTCYWPLESAADGSMGIKHLTVAGVAERVTAEALRVLTENTAVH